MKLLFPILSVITAAFAGVCPLMALVVAPADAQQGEVYRIIYYHVPSAWTAFLLFFINFIASIQYLVKREAFDEKGRKLDRHRDRSHWRHRHVPSAGKEVDSCRNGAERGGDDRSRNSGVLFPDRQVVPGSAAGRAGRHQRGSGSRFLHDRLDYRPDLGEAGVGNLVGAGRYSADFDAGAVADLCELSGVAPILEQRADADAGCCARGVWRPRCAAGVSLDLVFPHATSSARHRRRRIDGSAHAAHPPA